MFVERLPAVKMLQQLQIGRLCPWVRLLLLIASPLRLGVVAVVSDIVLEIGLKELGDVDDRAADRIGIPVLTVLPALDQALDRRRARRSRNELRRSDPFAIVGVCTAYEAPGEDLEGRGDLLRNCRPVAGLQQRPLLAESNRLAVLELAGEEAVDGNLEFVDPARRAEPTHERVADRLHDGRQI